MNTTEQAVKLMEAVKATKREKETCDGNHRVKDNWNSPRNRFYAAYRQVRFSRRFL